MKEADGRRLWVRSALAYTIGGTFSATLVGLSFGFLGAAADGVRYKSLGAALVLAVALTARDLGLVSFRLPQRRRQTEKDWFHEFGHVMAASMWGIHIGLGWATRMRFGGFWALTAAVIALGSPLIGVVSFVAYWLGRALPVWLAPMLVRDLDEALRLSELVGYERIYRFTAIVGLLGVVTLLAVRIWVSV